MVVVALRPDEIDPNPLRTLLGDAARSPNAVALDLQPLSVSAVRALVDDRPIDPEHLCALTGGTHSSSARCSTMTVMTLPAPCVTPSSRERSASETPRATCSTFSCALRKPSPTGCFRNSEIGIEPLRAAHQAGLTRRSPRGVAFRHDLCRQAIAGVLPPGAEAALHRRMLDALESGASEDAAVLVHHALGAGDPERVLRYATEAGTTAARTGAHAQAAEFFALALEHGKPDPFERADLLERLATEQYVLDRLDQAISSATQAMRIRQEVADIAAVSRCHQALATYEWYRANRGAADQHAAEAVAVLDMADEPTARGHALALQAYLAMQANEMKNARALLDQACGVALQSDDWSLDVRTRLLDGIFSLVETPPEGRDSIMQIVAPSVTRLDEIHSSGFSNLAYLDVEQRRLRDAAAVLDVSLPLTLEFDLPICHVWQLGARGRLGLLHGDWKAAEDDAVAVLESPSAPLARTWAHLIRGLISLRRTGDVGSDLDDAWELAPGSASRCG